MGIPKEFVEQLIEAAIADGALAIEDRCWVVTKWVQYQPKDAAERMREMRSRRAEDAEEAQETPDSEDSQVQTLRERYAPLRDVTNSPVTRDRGRRTEDIGQRTKDDRRTTKDKQVLDHDQGQGGKQTSSKMVEPPTVEMVCLRFQHHHGMEERASQVQALKFWNYHEGKGWTIRNKPMVSWTSAVQTWYRNLSEAEKDGSNYRTPVGTPNSTQNASAGQIDGKNGQLSGETSPRKTSIYNSEGMIRAEEVPQEWLQ
jgi:hypothetical protein